MSSLDGMGLLLDAVVHGATKVVLLYFFINLCLDVGELLELERAKARGSATRKLEEVTCAGPETLREGPGSPGSAGA